MDYKLDDIKRKIIMTVLYSLNIIFAFLIIVSFLINSKVLLFISSSFLLILSILNFVRVIILKETSFSKVLELIFIVFYNVLTIFLIFHFYNFAFATNVIKYSMYLVLLIANLIAGIGSSSEDKLIINTDPVIFAIIVMILPIIYAIIKIVNLYKNKN